MSAIDGFIARWDGGGGTEKANYQLFLTEVIALLGLPSPDRVGDGTELNSYVFERRVDIHKPDGSATCGFFDLYRRGRFVLETKLKGFDHVDFETVTELRLVESTVILFE